MCRFEKKYFILFKNKTFERKEGETKEEDEGESCEGVGEREGRRARARRGRVSGEEMVEAGGWW